MSELIALQTLLDLHPRDQESQAVWESLVSRVRVDREKGTMTLTLQPKWYLTKGALDTVREQIAKAYGMERVVMDADYTHLALEGDELAMFLREAFTDVFGAMRRAFYTADLVLEESQLILCAYEEYVFRLEQLRSQMETMAAELLGHPVRLELKSKSADQSFAQRREEELRRLAQEQAASMPAPAPKEPRKQKESVRQNSPGRRFEPVPKYKNEVAEEDILYGRPSAMPILKMEDVSMDTSKGSVTGTIFWKEARKINGKDKTVLTFDFTDGTGSLRASKVLLDEEAKELSGKLGPDTRVTVQGMISYSKYDRDLVISPSAIIKEKKQMRDDKSEEKRVELHLHTNMSAMDSLVDVKKGLELALHMGHNAMAITDHGVVHNFPDAEHALAGFRKKGKGKDFKLIFGVEAYCVNDLGSTVKGSTEAGIDDEIVVFDLETTGLSPKTCEIIEIAAVKVKNGQIGKEYHTYVKPETPIPGNITDLTGISNKTVESARSIAEVLPEFLEFCGDLPMAAHNANFDISFVKAACEQLGIQREFCYLDTVELCRALLPDARNHKLNTVAGILGFSFNHHRADEDTKVLAKIYVELIRRLKDQCDVVRFTDINQAVRELKDGSVGVAKARSHHLVILVKNQTGMFNLYKLISESHLKYFHRHPIIPLSVLMANREGLILGSACEAGELFSAVVDGKPWGELCDLARMFDYLEIQPIGNNAFMLRGDDPKAKNVEQLQEFNKTILRLGDSLHIPVVATGDVHFLNPEDAIYREVMMTGMGFSDADQQAPLYYRSTEDMLQEFAYLGPKRAREVVITNTNLVASWIDPDIRAISPEKCTPTIENSAETLERMARERAHELYGDPLPDIVAKRLDAELTPIINNGFDVMYMIAQKLVSKSIDDGYLVGSRGSVGSSVVAYFAGITEVNAMEPHYRCPNCKFSDFDVDARTYATGVDLPDKDCPHCGTKLEKDGFNIPFATFLGFKGEKAPDIDLNFSSEYQPRAHRETMNIFGEENVFKAGTIGTMQEKTALGYVRKYMEEKGVVLSRAEEHRLAMGIVGVKRTTGQHPGGLIILPKGHSIYEFCPVQHPADKTNTDIITTHFDYHKIDENLLKLDELGHEDPTMIKHLEDISGINARKIPLDDKETMKIFTTIAPLGIEPDDILGQTGAAAIPEFGTKFVRGMLMDTKPTTFDELLRISGLSHGTNVWLNNAQDYILQGKATLKDVICVRDDITIKLIAQGIEPAVSFKISESVRKGRGLTDPAWEPLMLEHGLPEWYIESCKKIEYMFPRAHAAAYVMMAYRIAWFKVHMPMVFYAAYFSIRAKGFDGSYMTKGDEVVSKKYRQLQALPKRTAVEDDEMSTLEIVHEFYRRGFTFAPVDIYDSDVEHFRIEGNTLIAPFTSLPGVGEQAAHNIVEERKNGPFMSQEEIEQRCDKVSRGVLETLGAAGALRDLPRYNQLNLFDF